MTSPSACGLGHAGVEAVDVADADLGHLLVAVLHLAHRPFQRDDGLLGVGDDGRQQVRDAVVDRQFQHLGVDHDEPALLRLQPVEQRQDHGVDGDRLARAGGAGDEQVRHAGEIDDDRLAADRLAERDGELVLGLARNPAEPISSRRNTVSRRWFGSSMPMTLRPWHHGDAGRDGRHRAGDVVGEADDAATT